MLWTNLEKFLSLLTTDLHQMLCKCHELLKWVDLHINHQVYHRAGYCWEDYYYLNKQKVSQKYFLKNSSTNRQARYCSIICYQFLSPFLWTGIMFAFFILWGITQFQDSFWKSDAMVSILRRRKVLSCLLKFQRKFWRSWS